MQIGDGVIESVVGKDAFENSELYFFKPWQAELFAIAVLLCDAGHLDRAELSEAVEQAISSASSSDGLSAGEESFTEALRTLESALADRGFANRREIDSAQGEWRQAYLATSHGEPVRL